jgi:hypothetical protein
MTEHRRWTAVITEEAGNQHLEHRTVTFDEQGIVVSANLASR